MTTKTGRATKVRNTSAATVQPPAATRAADAEKPAPAGGRSAKPDLHGMGARVVSVFGPFASRALVEMSVDLAGDLFPEPLGASGRTSVVEAVTRDLEILRRRAPDLADSALAASALALAYEIEHPYNSATSKSMCARALGEALGTLRDLAPPEEEADGITRLSDRRRDRRSGGGRATDQAGA